MKNQLPFGRPLNVYHDTLDQASGRPYFFQVIQDVCKAMDPDNAIGKADGAVETTANLIVSY